MYLQNFAPDAKYMTVEECFAYIRKHGIDSETIYTCYVMDSKRRLEGVVTVRNLIMNPYDAVVGDIMDDNVIKAITTMDQEEVVEMMNKYDLLSMPVVDSEDRLVGIITVDDVIDDAAVMGNDILDIGLVFETALYLE